MAGKESLASITELTSKNRRPANKSAAPPNQINREIDRLRRVADRRDVQWNDDVFPVAYNRIDPRDDRLAMKQMLKQEGEPLGRIMMDSEDTEVIMDKYKLLEQAQFDRWVANNLDLKNPAVLRWLAEVDPSFFQRRIDHMDDSILLHRRAKIIEMTGPNTYADLAFVYAVASGAVEMPTNPFVDRPAVDAELQERKFVAGLFNPRRWGFTPHGSDVQQRQGLLGAGNKMQVPALDAEPYGWGLTGPYATGPTANPVLAAFLTENARDNRTGQSSFFERGAKRNNPFWKNRNIGPDEQFAAAERAGDSWIAY